MFNALPSDVKFDVYIDEILLAKELEYKQFSYSIALSTLKTHTIKVFISNELNNPIIETQVQIHQANVETFAIVGSIEDPSILIITNNPPQQIFHNKSVIRYANLSESNMTVNVIRSNNIISSETIKSYEYTRYELIDPGTYNFQFILANTIGNDFKISTNKELKATRLYTFYIVGSADVNSIYPLEDYENIINILAPPTDITNISNPGSFKNINVAIIGGGASGLAAAFELRKLGFDITIFDALKDRIGGRIYTHYFDKDKKLYGELGPMRIPIGHETSWHYIDIFNLKTKIVRV